MLGLGFLAVSAVLLLAGAELFTEHAAGAGRRLRVSALAVGLVLAGAEPEELVTVVIAALRGRPGLAVGDAIGANVTMLTLVIGLAALFRPLPLGRRVRIYAGGAAVAGMGAVLVLADGVASRLEGGLLLAMYAGLLAVVWWREREPPAIGELAEALGDDHEDGVSPTRSLMLALVGIAVMAAGGTLAVQGAERVVAALSVGDTAVGLTLLALATTAELLALVWTAARREISELAVAAIVGSAAYNSTASLGAGALVTDLAAADARLPALVAALLPLAVLTIGAARDRLPRGAAIALLAVYAAYVALALL